MPKFDHYDAATSLGDTDTLLISQDGGATKKLTGASLRSSLGAHTQNTDTSLDEGGDNEVSAADLKTLKDTTVPAKMNKVSAATAGNLASFVAGGGLEDAFKTATELTIDGGSVAATGRVHTIDTAADGASDDLDTITGGAAGNLLLIRAEHTDRTVIIKHGTGNIYTGGSDIDLDDTTKFLLFYYDGELSKWVVVGGSGSGSSASYDTFWVGAGAVTPCTTNGATAITVEYGTNDIDLDVLTFDSGATEERAQFNVVMPENWDRGTLKAKFYWTNATGASAADTVEWGIKVGALSNDDAIDAALGTAVTVSDTVIAAGDLHTTDATAAITVGGTPALGDLVQFEVYRNTDGTDNMTEDAYLIGFFIQYGLSGTVSGW